MLSLRPALLAVLFLSATQLQAEITPLAISGDPVPGLSGAAFESFGMARLNSTAQIGFIATLQTDVGDISSFNNIAVFGFDEALALKAQIQSGNVPGVANASYDSFEHVSVDQAGNLLLKAKLARMSGINAENNQGFWSFGPQEASLLLRTGTDLAADVPNAKFEVLGGTLQPHADGSYGFLGGLMGVSGDTKQGAWRYHGSTGRLLGRKGWAAPDVPGGIINAISSPTFIGPSRSAMQGSLKEGGTINIYNRACIWVFDEQTGELSQLVRAGWGDVPGSTSDFSSFENLTGNDANQLAFSAKLATGQQGLWLYTGDSGTNVALSKAGNVPGLPSANFLNFSKPYLSDTGQVVVLADLEKGEGGVTSANDKGLWLFDESQSNQLLARKGIAAPHVDGNFDTLQYFAPLGNAGVYLQATLQHSVGTVEALTGDAPQGDEEVARSAMAGVDETNDQGIWHIPFEGDPELLVRKGDSLAGRTIAELSLATATDLFPVVTGIVSGEGDLLFHASFTNGDSGLFLYSPAAEIEYLPADFNRDGFVDQQDLAIWQSGYGNGTAGDADQDGVTDGADFLVWQRLHTSTPTEVETMAVPEPGVGLCVLCLATVLHYTRRVTPRTRR